MKRLWIIILLVFVCLGYLTACDALGLRPIYPPTFTPPPPSPTNPVTTLVATSTPIPTEIFPTFTPNPSGLKSAWVINTIDRTLLRIDPASQQVLNTIQVNGLPIDIVIGEGAVWAIEGIDSEHSNILRIDPVSNQISTRIPITSGEAISMAAGGGSVWIGIAGEYGINQAPGGGVEFSRSGTILRIDPIANQVAEMIGIDALPAALFVEDQSLWILATKKSYSYLNRIDLEDRMVYTIPDGIQSADYIHRFQNFIKLGVWLWMTPQDPSAQYIFRVSSVDGIVDSSISLGESSRYSPASITSDGTDIWVALRNGNIQKINPVTRLITSTIKTDSNSLTDIFYSTGYIWAFDYGGSSLFQIDPQSEQIIQSFNTGSSPPPTPTPTITPTANPNLIWALCDQSFPTHLRVGINAIVNSSPPIPNRVRIEPSSDALILGYIQPGEIVEILTGPVCANGWVWWNIKSIETEITGWTSEGDGIDYWLLPLE